VEEEERKEGA
jgi:hypothetical protein